MAFAQRVYHILHQQRNIIAPLAQGRQFQIDYIQAIQQILAQLIIADGFVWVFIGCRQHAHIHGNFAVATDAPQRAIFQHAKQLGLQRDRHLSNFVQKQGAAIGQFKATFAAHNRACEGAFFVAKEFRFHQRFRDGRAVDGQEGIGGARTELMNRLRHQIFARARFAGN